MKYYLIAGEASGDLHGSHLIRELKKADPVADIRCWGGDKMQAAGGTVVRHIRDLAFMGFWEVVKHLGTILSNIRYCKKDILEFQPDVVILIDYPGFNFRLFPFLKQHRLKIFYYISPQLWAWKTSRVKQVKEHVDRMFVIFPFEKEFYAKHGIEVDFVGHPLLDEIPKTDTETQNRKKTIAILPGSRKQEISYLLPEYLKIIPDFPDYRFMVTGMSNIGENFYLNLIGDARCELVMDQTYEVLRQSAAAVVTSGTASLETALLGVPEVVSYKGSWVSYQIAKLLIKNIRFICIVNLICDEKVVTELIQNEVNHQRLAEELHHLLSEEGRTQILKGYDLLKSKIGEPGASRRAAEKMLQYLNTGFKKSNTP